MTQEGGEGFWMRISGSREVVAADRPVRSQARRVAEAVIFVALWMALGWALHPGA